MRKKFFRNHSNMLICCSRNISSSYYYYLQLNIFVETDTLQIKKRKYLMSQQSVSNKYCSLNNINADVLFKNCFNMKKKIIEYCNN